jgi:hypothetical protein
LVAGAGVGWRQAAPAGVEIGILDVDLYNGSTSTFVVDSVDISGPGIGTVVRKVRVEIAPLSFESKRTRAPPTAGSTKVTRRSTSTAIRTTRRPFPVSRPFPVRGFRMTPGTRASAGLLDGDCHAPALEHGSVSAENSDEQVELQPLGPTAADEFHRART